MTQTNTSAFDPQQFKQMSRQQWDTAAAAWHRHAPLLSTWLGPITERMLDRAGVAEGSHVLDIAAGTGEQSIAAAMRVGDQGLVLATDLSSAILQYAAANAREQGLMNLRTRTMDGEQVGTLGQGIFDCVISRFGIFFFTDRAKGMAGIFRVLKPGGRFSAIVWGPPERNRCFSVPMQMVRQRAGLPEPPPEQPTPFSLADESLLRQMLADAGFAQVQVDRVAAPMHADSAADCAAFLRDVFNASPKMFGDLTEDQRRRLWRDIEHELKQFESADGFTGPCELLVAGGVKP